MQISYFAMPVHPLTRDWADTLEEDRQAVILADRLGFESAFIGEHLSDRCEAVTNSFQFLASLIPATQQIKLGTGTSNLSQIHPVVIAAQAAMFDHMARGRFIFGISAGALPSDAEALGLLSEDRNKIFAEAIDVILEIWKRDAPYDIALPDNRFRVSTATTQWPELGVGAMHKPYQNRLPEIVGTVVAPFSPGVIAMGRRDFHPMSANFLLSKWLRSHFENYAKGKAEVGLQASPTDWRVARTIFVADDDVTAESYGARDESSPYRFYYRQMMTKLVKGGRANLFKDRADEPDESVTLERVLDRLVLRGSPNRVVDQILALREEIGDFGSLVYAGMDWVDERLGRRSMELMAEKVMPAVNAALR